MTEMLEVQKEAHLGQKHPWNPESGTLMLEMLPVVAYKSKNLSIFHIYMYTHHTTSTKAL